jgi:hypothetical protein
VRVVEAEQAGAVGCVQRQGVAQPVWPLIARCNAADGET